MFKKLFSFVNLSALILFSFLSSSAFAQSVQKTLGFFDGALLVDVTGPKTLSAGANKDNKFLIQIKDSNGTAYPAIKAQFVTASVEMTNMDMGSTPVKKVEDVLDANKQLQGKISIEPTFAMKGPWKLNIKITVSDDNGAPTSDTQSVTFDVNK
ncbi:MAG: hypothetical protein ACXVCY_18065 [Pseudobdellovibrionaceae bacterium]